MFALKESPLKMLYGNTNESSTVPDAKPIPSLIFDTPFPNNKNVILPKRLDTAFEALSNTTTTQSKKESFAAAINAGPFYEDNHLILANSFNEKADNATHAWNSRVLKRLPGTYLVDIQRIWEGYDGRWVQNTPLLLRFETIDIVLTPSADGKSISVWTGYLDTNAPVYVQRNNSPEAIEANKYSCLNWLTYRRNTHSIGKKVVNAQMFSLVSCLNTPIDAAQESSVDLDKSFEEDSCSEPRTLFILTLENNKTYTFVNKSGNLYMCS